MHDDFGVELEPEYRQKNCVTARLTATYNLSKSDANSPKDIDYLCVYEFQYKENTYKYRMRQRDHFSPIPEEMELVFENDPNRAYPKPKEIPDKPGVEIKPQYPLYILTAMGILALAFLFWMIIQAAGVFFEDGVPLGGLLVVAVFLIISLLKVKKQRSTPDNNALIEEAMTSNRTAMAYRGRFRFLGNNDLDRRYKAKYSYIYQGKKYSTVIYTSATPPESIRVFFGKNPRKIVCWKR